MPYNHKLEHILAEGFSEVGEPQEQMPGIARLRRSKAHGSFGNYIDDSRKK